MRSEDMEEKSITSNHYGGYGGDNIGTSNYQ